MSNLPTKQELKELERLEAAELLRLRNRAAAKEQLLRIQLILARTNGTFKR